MRLRNKKTGEVKDWDFSNWYQAILNPENKEKYECNLNDFIDRTVKFREEWEDVNAEPLIKDEKIRKAVKVWAELAPSAQVRYDCSEGRFYTSSNYVMPCSISFPARLGLDEMTDYTIAELCGEEEE